MRNVRVRCSYCMDGTPVAVAKAYPPRNLKGGIWSLFEPCVNALGRQPYCLSCMEGSYCTFGFGAKIMICAHYHYSMIHRGITDMRARFDFARERQLTLNEIIWWA